MDIAGSFLYQNRDGHFLDVRTFAGLGHLRSIGSVAPADYDNDGDTDWYATRVAETAGLGNILFRNEGDGTVSDVADQAGVKARGRPVRTFGGTLFFDYDNDGWLDLFVPNSSGEDFLYRNQQDGSFGETTVGAGLARPEGTGAPAPGDVDGDGLIDLFTSVGAGPDALYRNQGDGSFRDMASEAGIEHAPEWDLSSARFFDADNDGDLDLYGISGDVDFAHVFYRNSGAGTFVEAGEAAGLRGPTAASLGLVSGDFDNDGWVDLFVSVVGEPNLLYFNQGDGRFSEGAVAAGLPAADLFDDLVASAGDFNRDGFLDLFVNNFDFAPENALFENGGNQHHWLQIELVGVTSNRSAIGARVLLRAGELSMLRQIGRGETLLVEFGLAANDRVDLVEVQWPSGSLTRIEDVAADQQIRVFEDRPGFFPIVPTTWEEVPLDSVVVGSRVPVRGVVRPALFEEGAQIAAVTADLSGLGGLALVPLQAVGDGTYRLDEVVVVGEPHGQKLVLVHIAQNTSLGPYRTTLSAAVVAAPPAYRLIYRQGIAAGWDINANARVEIAFNVAGPAGRTAKQLRGGGRLWRVEYVAETPFEAVGYAALRFAFHPGDAVLPARGPRFSANINLGGQIASLLELGVDLERREWQQITVPMSALNVELPIEFVRLTGNLDGTFYIDDVHLVAAVPSQQPTAVEPGQPAQPRLFSLDANYPNPFNGATAIRFTLENPGAVELNLYNTLGQKVHTLIEGYLAAGQHSVSWDGRNGKNEAVSSGVYIYRLRLGQQALSRRLLLVR